MTRIILRSAILGDKCNIYVYYADKLVATSPCGRLEGLPEWLAKRLERASMLDTVRKIAESLRPGEERVLHLPFYA